VSEHPPIAGVILAGGRGRRMGGRDKAWVEYRGTPLIERVLKRFAPQVDHLIVSANRDLERYAGVGLAVVADVSPGHPGPLAGLQAAFRATSHELLAAVPCDGPFLPLDLVARLYRGLHEHAAQVAVACAAGRVHPVFCLCARSVAPSIDAALASGQRRLEAWCRSVPMAEVEFEDAGAFRNLNTLDELGDASGEG
jgi:molybdopterin-guanine dinucleotide biosynthesis protein A